MARYIDADVLTEMLNKKAQTDLEMGLYNHGTLTQSFIRFVERQPTADVAPRAEVAREIFEEIDKFLKEKHQAVDDIWCDIEDDDEVLNAFYMAKTESYFVVKNFVDELKKKYTEEN